MIPILEDTGMSMVIYNKTLLDKAGVPVPTPEWTYDNEWLEALKTLKDALGDEAWTWVPQTGSFWGYQAALDAWGTSMFDRTGRELLICDGVGEEMLQFWATVFEQGLVPKAGEMPGGTNQMFTGGQLVLNTTFTPVIPWLTGTVEEQFETGNTMMPKGPGPDGKNGGTANVHFVGMNSNTRHPDLAWEYMKWFSGPEMAQPLWDAGLIPARHDMWSKPENIGQYEAYKLTAKQLPNVSLQSLPWNFRGREAEDALKNTMDAVWLGETPFSQGLDAACDAVNAILEKPLE
jgi:multiple sugar transport system substrate-binding protein